MNFTCNKVIKWKINVYKKILKFKIYSKVINNLFKHSQLSNLKKIDLTNLNIYLTEYYTKPWENYKIIYYREKLIIKYGLNSLIERFKAKCII